MDKSLAKYGFSRDDIITDVLWRICISTIVVEVWNKDKTGYEPAFKKRQILV
jgi:hypothetical protein